jgi:enoyl-CoA hydratase
MSQPSLTTLKLDIVDAVATVTLNRPDKANAMNAPMWQELQTCFEWLDSEPAVRVIILAANGKHFCSGIDLALFGDVMGSPEQEPSRRSEALRQIILRLQGNLSAIERCRKPVLAAIHSSCIGGGVDMVSCCDMRYCTEQAYFSIKEIDIAMTADVGTLQRLPHIIGRGVMHEIAYTGRRVEASEALSIGLVNRVFPDAESLLEGVKKIAIEIAAKSPLAIRGTKEMLLYTRDHPVSDALNYMATWNAGMLSTADVMKAVAANMQGEPAEFDD